MLVINNKEITKEDMQHLNHSLKRAIAEVENDDKEAVLYRLRALHFNLNRNLEADGNVL